MSFSSQLSMDKSSKSNIREKLIRFFLRRPTMDDLFKKGIIRNEPVFGSTLRELELSEGNQGVPHFVTRSVCCQLVTSLRQFCDQIMTRL